MSSPPAVILRGNGSELPGPVPGAVAIGTSVGKGGRNQGADTRAVQIAFNSVPAAMGGAGESLAVDGICGPLTIGAISTFQQLWLTVRDSRCDPAGPTLALANAMAGVGDALPSGTTAALAASPVIVAAKPAKTPGPPKMPRPRNPAELARIRAAELRQFVVEKHHMRIVNSWLLTALRVLGKAERHVKRLQDLPSGSKLPDSARNDPDRVAFLLVAKTFKLHERLVANAVAGVRRVESILRQSMLAVSARLPPRTPVVSPAPTVNAPLFISLFGISPNGRGALAYAPRGGLHLKPGPSGFFNAFVVPGRVVPERVDRIYLTPSFDEINSNLQRLTMIHELAHWVGTPNGAGAVPEIATVDRPAQWRALNSNQRLHTADSYGFFATECNVGTFAAVQDAESNFNAIPINPFVEANFVNPEPVITLPPSHHTDSPKFDFPAGALF